MGSPQRWGRGCIFAGSQVLIHLPTRLPQPNELQGKLAVRNSFNGFISENASTTHRGRCYRAQFDFIEDHECLRQQQQTSPSTGQRWRERMKKRSGASLPAVLQNKSTTLCFHSAACTEVRGREGLGVGGRQGREMSATTSRQRETTRDSATAAPHQTTRSGLSGPTASHQVPHLLASCPRGVFLPRYFQDEIGGRGVGAKCRDSVPPLLPSSTLSRGTNSDVGNNRHTEDRPPVSNLHVHCDGHYHVLDKNLRNGIPICNPGKYFTGRSQTIKKVVVQGYLTIWTTAA